MTQNIEDIYFPVKNGLMDFGDMLGTLSHTFSNDSRHLQGFLSQDAGEDIPAKHYATVANFPFFVEGLIVENKKDFHLYELIPAEKPVYPYFDLEWDADQLPEMVTLYRVLEVIAECLQSVGCEGDGLSIYCASGACSTSKISSGKKASYHVICLTDKVFSSVGDHKAFVEHVLLPRIQERSEWREGLYWTDPNGARKCVVDKVPYNPNQNFRLPYQSKWSSAGARPLLPFDVVKTFGLKEANLFYVRPFVELPFIVLPDRVATAKKAVGSSSALPVEFSQKESPEFALVCALCEVLSETRLDDRESCRNLIWCLWGIEKTKRMLALLHTTCARSVKYNLDPTWVNSIVRDHRHTGFHLASLVFWAKADAGVETVNTILKAQKVLYNKELFECYMIPAKHTVLSERYLGSAVGFADGTTSLIIKSHLGTGKTVAISNIIRSASYKRILVVSPRKSYTHAQKGALDEFTSYLDVPFGDLADESRIIIQVESLHRIGSGFQKYDLVILDEVESILNQLHSVKTNATNLIANHEVLGMAVSTASHVVFADAFLSDRTFHFAKELRETDTTHYFENTYNPYQRMAVFLPSVEKDKRVANIGGFCERIMNALREGRRIVVVWTSKRRGDAFVANFLEKWSAEKEGCEAPSWVFYNSMSTKEEQEGLKNVDVTWRDVQCLMMTTSITVGISYDPKVAELEFDEAFLYGVSSSAMPRDIAQALFRVRSLKAKRLTYVVDSRAAYVSGVRGFNNIWNEVTAKENKVIRDHPVVKWTTCPQWTRFNYVYCENEERNSRAEYQTVLEEYLVRSGYTLCQNVHIPDPNIAAIELDADERERLRWDVIQDIDWAWADHHLKKMKCGEATVEEILEYKKWRFRSEFVEGCAESDLRAWWERFYEAGHEGRFQNVLREKRWTVEHVAQNEAVKRYAMMGAEKVTERETLGRFLKIVGMSHSQEAVVLDSARLDAVGAAMCAAEKEIREGLGLRQGRKKSEEWKVAHTIDLITVVLEGWGCGVVESKVKQCRKSGKVIREYSLRINTNNKIWNNIKDSAVNYEENLIKV